MFLQLSADLGFPIRPKANLTFSKCLEMKLQDHIGVIAKVAEVAGKEYSIEQALDKMEGEWEPVQFEILPYKETGTYILRASEDVSQLLDDHIVMTQSMSFSPFKKPFEERISTWESKLRTTQVRKYLILKYFPVWSLSCNFTSYLKMFVLLALLQVSVEFLSLYCNGISYEGWESFIFTHTNT